MRRLAAGLLAVAAFGLPAISAQCGVANTKHNLSVSGPGAIRATEETQICLFCHTPHNASPRGPLWNRRDSGGTYTPYSSSTAVAAPGQPTGASVICLSCHDGTIALGEVLSRSTPITLAGGVTTMPSGSGRLGTDLSDDHPISFVYSSILASQRGELADPATLTGPVRTDATGQLQCTACHDPHIDTYGQFLVLSNQSSALCRTCHVKNYWSQSSHRLSSATWNGVSPDPWPHTSWVTVADNACESCHRPHSAGGRQRLLNYPAEEDNCYSCHNGNVAAKNLQAEFSKVSRHPLLDTTGVHDPAEASVVQARHVECVDCHNPHGTKSGAGTPPGPLTGIRGVTLAGAGINPITSEYQVCFRCHGDSPGKPTPPTPRQIAQANVRLEFDTVNPSFHPVAGPGKNPNVPSLIAPLTVSSTLRCSDCHNNNSGSNAGGVGPNGPHGSAYPRLLERQYLTLDNTSESSSAYALCYKCHSRTSILGDQSFSKHKLHIVEKKTPCNICHDPHGISVTQGNSINNSKLINFDISVVTPDSSGRFRYESQGTFKGACYLKCHNQDHKPETYP